MAKGPAPIFQQGFMSPSLQHAVAKDHGALEAECDRLKAQRDQLLGAIEEHEANREQHPKGPSKRNARLWAVAQSIREES